MDQFAEYICGSCGERIETAVDASAGLEQSYVEDCPVCCRPNVLFVRFDGGGAASIECESE